MTEQVVDIHPFDFATVPSNGLILLIGKRGTGKTTYSQYTLQFSKYKSEGIFVVMCGNDAVKHAWSSYVAKLFLIDPSVEYLQELIDTCNRLVQKYGEYSVPKEHHVTLVMDDVACISKLMNSKQLQYIASNSRHLPLQVIILAQYFCQVSKEVRSQFDMVIALATANRKNINALYEEYCSVVEMRVFKGILSAVTENYGALVIDNTGHSSDINHVCKYAKIHPYPPDMQKLGSPDAWEYSRTHFLNFQELQSKLKKEEDEKFYSDEEDVDVFSSNEIKQIANQTKTFTDRLGKLIIRKVSNNNNNKSKTD